MENLDSITRASRIAESMSRSFELYNQTISPAMSFTSVMTKAMNINKFSQPSFYDAINPKNTLVDNMAKAINNFSSCGNYNHLGIGRLAALAQASSTFAQLNNTPLSKALGNIQQNHTKLMAGWQSLSKAMTPGIELYRLQSMQAALGGLAFKIATENIRAHNWEALEDFEEISAEVAELNDKVVDQEFATKGDMQRVLDLLVAIHARNEPKDRTANSFFLIIVLWLGLINDIISLSTTIRDWASPNQQEQTALTKADLEAMKLDIFNYIDTRAREQKENRVLTNNCHLRLKPSTKSISLGVQTKGSEAIILLTEKKWAYVKITDKDGLPVHGWLFKKYLKK